MKVESIERRAMYEAREFPKFCPRCKKDINKITSRWETADGVMRKRLCICGKVFLTRSEYPLIVNKIGVAKNALAVA